VPPMGSEGNERLDGVRVIVGAIPFPESRTTCGLPVALVVRVSAPTRGPLPTGPNRTSIVQAELAGREAGQSVELVNSPVVAMLEISKAPLPVFETVTIAGALSDPTRWSPKAIGAVDKLKAPNPFPESVTVLPAPQLPLTVS